ncbi:MFS transporter [Spelaeicoccus albus]|uniref:YNFM family putative membrane transporter n=1 Tax=Spelaeicoccus albus TaxID=1280376 RepID=A0A7Z0D166_9MICO|nr:MFS transporter [Spelaeicoccus albus]NYI65757.1 YNFM family putative membrane transporter [Spelaeicoccus albus]
MTSASSPGRTETGGTGTGYSKTGRWQGYTRGDKSLRDIRIALFLAGIATFALLYSTQAILPELSSAFSISTVQSTYSVSVSTIGLGIGLLIAGPLSEILGRTRLIHISLFAAAACGLVIAFAPSWNVLLLGRGIEGLVLAGLPAVAAVYLKEEVHAGLAAGATGLYIAGTALGGMLGRLVGAGLVEMAGTGWPAGGALAAWQVSLLGNGVMGLGCAIACLTLLPRSRGFVPAPKSVSYLAKQFVKVFTDPALLALYGIAAVMMGSFVGVYNTLGFRLEAAPFALSVGAAGLVFLVYPVGSVSSVLAGRIADKVGQRAVVPIAALVTIGGIALTLVGSLPVIIIGTAIMTAGFFATHGLASGWVAARASAGVGGAAQAASIYMVSYYIGSSIGGSVAGAVFAGLAWPGVAAMAVTLVAIAFVISLGLRSTKKLA